MAIFSKPSDINKVWASGGDVLTPSDTKIATGWQVEIPPRQYFNYIDQKQDYAIAHINQHGVAVWDNVTEYQANKSYTQGPTNGTIYRCVATHTNQNPETDVSNTYWQIAFAAAGEFYTKVETDALYLAKAQNLADLPNTATARTNLSVYAKSETYTKAEVDSKTTVASAAQSQALTSNTTLITPQRLGDAFKGGNQSLVTNGWQKLPGGLIIQWGRINGVDGSDVNIVFPVQFSLSAYSLAIAELTGPVANPIATTSLSNTGFTANTVTAGQVYSYIAIGQ